MAEATYDVSNALGTINKNLSTVNNNVLEGLKGIDVVLGVLVDLSVFKGSKSDSFAIMP